MHEQRSPASGTRVAGRDRRHRQRPVDREIGIVVRDDQIFRGIVRTIDPIAHICCRSQRLEAMEETRRYVKMPKFVVVEQKCLLPPKGRRVPSNVDKDVVDGTVGAPDQLRLTTP